MDFFSSILLIIFLMDILVKISLKVMKGGGSGGGGELLELILPASHISVTLPWINLYNSLETKNQGSCISAHNFLP